ncbi:MAG: sodium:solute symporter family protein [Proteobacteria bacterium]|nr:sodium:solute symporter family protein [Burkholderiales bacterium]
MLLTLVVLYLLGTIALGLWAAKRVKTSADFAIAGRNLPLVMIITTTFATWFGAETVLGIPAKFVDGGLGAVVEDPFGAGSCLILVGLFFAARLYRMTLLTISDYFRERFGRNVEVLCSLIIIVSYLGWVAAQVTALGLVFNLLSDGAISIRVGMVIGTMSVLAYAMFGGMWSVAVTDFVQMIVLVVGLSAIAFFAAELAGGADQVLAVAASRDLFRFLPEPGFTEIAFFIGAAITIMFGSIPQQDVFQRVMSARDVKAATRGPVIGGVCYILFAFVPMFIVVSALVVMPEQAEALMRDDPQKVIPTLVLERMPFVMQVLFFGALLSALKSTASATLLAPSVTFVENVWRHRFPATSDREQLRTMRITVLVFSVCVCAYAIASEGTPIYDMVSATYQVTLVGAFVPLAAGLFWARATTQGAVMSIVFGLLGWVALLVTPAGEVFPAQLAGLGGAIAGMVIGSLAPQRAVQNRHGAHLKVVGLSEPQAPERGAS